MLYIFKPKFVRIAVPILVGASIVVARLLAGRNEMPSVVLWATALVLALVYQIGNKKRPKKLLLSALVCFWMSIVILGIGLGLPLFNNSPRLSYAVPYLATFIGGPLLIVAVALLAVSLYV